MTIRDFAIFVAIGAAIFGFVHNNTVAVTTWLRQAAVKLVHWITTEAGAGVTDVEALFKKKPVATPAPALAPAVAPALAAALRAPGTAVVNSVNGTVNGIAVPVGLTLADFVSLVLATQAAASQLADVALAPFLVAASEAWWNSLGEFFREEFVAQSAANPKYSAFSTAFSALQAKAAVPLKSITPAQQAAANSAA